MLRERKRRDTGIAVFVFLGVLVTAVVAGIFHQPAVAKTYQKTILTCTAEAPVEPGYAGYFVHTHNDDCFDENGNLRCSLPEIQAHAHDDSCYTTTTVQICTLPESDGHVHTEDCYTPVRGELICGQEESEDHKKLYFNEVGPLNLASDHLKVKKLWETNNVDSRTPRDINLAVGKYYLVETDAPAGYILKADPVEITVATTEVFYNDGTSLSGSGSGISQTEDTYQLTVTNNAGYELPATGGEGAVLFYVLGTILILSSTLLFLAKRKQEAYTRKN